MRLKAATRARPRVLAGTALALAAVLLAWLLVASGGNPAIVRPSASGPNSVGPSPAADVRLLQRIVPGFCKDRLATPEELRLLGVSLPTSYPPGPADVGTGGGQAETFHPLGTLTPYLVALDNRALLGEVSASVDGAAISALIDHLRSSRYLLQRGDTRVLIYPDPIDQVPAPFISSMSQSALAYLASVSFLATGRSSDLELARQVLGSFRVGIADGGLRSVEGSGAWYEEYATPALSNDKLLFVLNGFVYSLDNLAKMLSMGMDAYLPELAGIYADGLAGLREALPKYETTFGWTYYDGTGNNRATAAYHSYQTILIRELGCREKDTVLLGTAARWWGMYKQKMPFWLIQPDPAIPQITYAHLKGTYPHPYLRDEYRTYAIAVSASGDQRAVPISATSAFASAPGVPDASLNLDTAVLPTTARRLELWWFADHDMGGLPNIYKIDDLDLQASVEAGARLGLAGACDGAPTVPIDAAGINGRPGLFVAKINVAPDSGATCVALDSRVEPTRITRPLVASQAVVASRGLAVTDSGGGSIAVEIGPPSGTGDYRDHQAAIVISGLDVDPMLLPYLVLPVSAPRVAALTVDAVAGDGSRISRYVPIQDGQLSPQTIVLDWESFPGFSAKRIASIDIRIFLPDGVASERAQLGPLTVVAGPEGLVSTTDFVVVGPGRYQLRSRTDGGWAGFTFLRQTG